MGGSSITSYNLQWDAGTNGATWTSLVGEASDFTGTSFTVSSGVSGGNTYQFKVRAANILGWGSFSSVVSLVASGVPSQMDPPTTALSGSTVTISWSAATDNSATVTAYLLEILQSDGSYYTDTTNCDASTDPVLSARSCALSLTTLRASPYSLAQGDLVVARVSAQNANGWSDVSEVNTSGANIETEPGQMSAPFAGSATSSTQLQVEWAAVSNTGGSAITSYHLQQETSVGSGTWNDLQGENGDESTLTSFTVTGLTQGTNYSFRVRAVNQHGEGAYSAETTLVPVDVPEAPSAPTVTATGAYIKIQFTAPSDNNGAAVTGYAISIRQSDDSTYTESTSLCDGTDSTTISNMYCLVLMSDLMASPYSLSRLDEVFAKVKA